jgi:hypothetical protein
MSEHCEQHQHQMNMVNELRTDVAVIRRDLEHVVGRICQHIEEAERPGGWRDKMSIVEAKVTALEQQMQADRIMGRWFMLGAGVLSAGLMSGAIKIWAVLSRTLGI